LFKIYKNTNRKYLKGFSNKKNFNFNKKTSSCTSLITQSNGREIIRYWKIFKAQYKTQMKVKNNRNLKKI